MKTAFEGFLPKFPYNVNLPQDLSEAMHEQDIQEAEGKTFTEDERLTIKDIAISGVDQINELKQGYPFDPKEWGFIQSDSPGVFFKAHRENFFLQRSTEDPSVYLIYVKNEEGATVSSMPVFMPNVQIAQIVLRATGFLDMIEDKVQEANVEVEAENQQP